MQERLKTHARKHRQRLKCIAWTAVALLILIPGGAPNTTKDLPGNTMQIPSALRQWTRLENPETPAALRLFKRGVDAYLDKRYDSALDLLPGEQEAKTTAVADYMLLYKAKARLMADRNQEALDGFRGLEKQFPESPLLQDALLGQCQALLKLQDAASALAVLANPKSRKNSDALYYQARAFELAGQKEKAVELYLQYYAAYPKAGFEALAQHSLLALSPSALKGKRSYAFRLQRAENLLRASDVRGAKQLLVALAQVVAPDSKSSQKRDLLLAEAEYRLDRTTMALSYLHKVTAADPAMHAKALRLEGYCYRKSDKEPLLIAQRDRALKLYPRSGETEELCYSVATYFDVNYEPEKARNAYQVLYERFPKGRYAERASWKLSLSLYFQKEYGEAASGFWSYLKAYPGTASSITAMYWMGRCYQALGGAENARYLFRRVQALANDSYFGMCARDAESSLNRSGSMEKYSVAGIAFDQVMATCDALRLSTPYLPEPGKAVFPAIERARLLWSAELPDMAVSELRWASQRFPQDEKPLSYLIAQIQASSDDYHHAIANLRGIVPDYVNMPVAALPDEIWQLLFPMHHLSVISNHAAKSELDPFLVMGLIRQESAFNENARSSADARGLMQILPATGLKLARQANIRPYNSKKLFHAETNIALGTLYLASLVRQYGRVELALAAYNAGSTRVDRWLKEFGDVDMPEFIEKIPFSETRGYIRQVLSNKSLYTVLASSAAPAIR
ncbi:MAG TPA: transglycosylase SLT domain-containing protein [Acidobacteriota bacterium]|nr:transglycosylase SLT domain-containing protein [Acidobacteriota bacterium]